MTSKLKENLTTIGILIIVVGTMGTGLFFLFSYLNNNTIEANNRKEAECAKVAELAGSVSYQFDKDYYNCYITDDGKVIKVDL